MGFRVSDVVQTEPHIPEGEHVVTIDMVRTRSRANSLGRRCLIVASIQPEKPTRFRESTSARHQLCRYEITVEITSSYEGRSLYSDTFAAKEMDFTLINTLTKLEADDGFLVMNIGQDSMYAHPAPLDDFQRQGERGRILRNEAV